MQEDQKNNQENRNQIQSFSAPVISFDRGKLPPQALDLEEAVLGAMMTDKKGVDEVVDMLKPEVFYKTSHQAIFEAMIMLFEKNNPIDLLTVSDELKRLKKLEIAGGDAYLAQLSMKVTSSAHIEYHAHIVMQQYIKRSLISICSEVSKESYEANSDAIELRDKAESKIYDIALDSIKKSTNSAQKLVLEARKKIQEMGEKEGVSGVISGFDNIDALTSGWQPSDLIVIAARPGMGKTAFALSMARNIAVGRDVPVAFFSLEMSSLQIITRLISSETNISSEKLRTGKLDESEITQLDYKLGDLENAPLYIDDPVALSIFELRAKARRLASQYGIKIIIIDYLQLMTTGDNKKNGNREQEISAISRSLKALAKELDISIVALAQLSRAVESRSGSKRPLLSDLRESGAIEQDADIVSFIYRPEYYDLSQWDDEQGSSTKGQAEFIVAKHRNGGLGKIRLKFVGKFGRFENLIEFDEVESKLNRH